jgi:hypothetical protein
VLLLCLLLLVLALLFLVLACRRRVASM